jgi:hypothetical protein
MILALEAPGWGLRCVVFCGHPRGGLDVSAAPYFFPV